MTNYNDLNKLKTLNHHSINNTKQKASFQHLVNSGLVKQTKFEMPAYKYQITSKGKRILNSSSNQKLEKYQKRLGDINFIPIIALLVITAVFLIFGAFEPFLSLNAFLANLGWRSTAPVIYGAIGMVISVLLINPLRHNYEKHVYKKYQIRLKD